EAEGGASPMLARATRARAGMERPVLSNWNRGVFQRMAVSNGFLRRILHHAQTDVVIELILRYGVVCEPARPPPFKDTHPPATPRYTSMTSTTPHSDFSPVFPVPQKTPVQPPPMMATSTGLRLVMTEPRFLFPQSIVGSSPRHTATPDGVLQFPSYSSSFSSV